MILKFKKRMINFKLKINNNNTNNNKRFINKINNFNQLIYNKINNYNFQPNLCYHFNQINNQP